MSGKPLPHLMAAFFCERILEEKDGVLSAIRIVDRITAQAQFAHPSGVVVQALPGVAPPEKMPPFPINLIALVAFKAGAAAGTFNLELLPRNPAGMKMPGISFPILVEGGEDRGINVRLQVNFVAETEGLYWFDVLLDGTLVTRIPLRVLYQRISMSQPPQL